MYKRVIYRKFPVKVCNRKVKRRNHMAGVQKQ